MTRLFVSPTGWLATCAALIACGLPSAASAQNEDDRPAATATATTRSAWTTAYVPLGRCTDVAQAIAAAQAANLSGSQLGFCDVDGRRITVDREGNVRDVPGMTTIRPEGMNGGIAQRPPQ